MALQGHIPGSIPDVASIICLYFPFPNFLPADLRFQLTAKKADDPSHRGLTDLEHGLRSARLCTRIALGANAAFSTRRKVEGRRMRFLKGRKGNAIIHIVAA